jgi:hypothetical protein
MTPGSRTSRRARGIRRLIATACVLLPACAETTGPDEPFSLTFHPLPSPSIVSGDSLRDIDGAAVPLSATVFNLRGEPIDMETEFVALDTSGAIVINPLTGFVKAEGTRRGTARIVARSGTLQAAPVQLQIVPAPSAAAAFGTIDTLRYSFSNPSLNTSDALEVKVTRDSANAPVPAYLVRFRLEDPADTVVARLVDDAGRTSTVDRSGAVSIDTTGSLGTAAGVASRRIRLTPSASLRLPVDSIVVFADVRLRGVHVAGSPVRLVLPVKPRNP